MDLGALTLESDSVSVDDDPTATGRLNVGRLANGANLALVARDVTGIRKALELTVGSLVDKGVVVLDVSAVAGFADEGSTETLDLGAGHCDGLATGPKSRVLADDDFRLAG